MLESNEKPRFYCSNEKIWIDDIYECAYILAPLYMLMVQFIKDNSRYPVKILMRDGLPISFIAKLFNQYNILDTSDFEDVYLTRMTTFNLIEAIEKDIKDVNTEYFSQKGIEIGKQFTLVDTGFKGSIPRDLVKLGYQIDTLFMAGSQDFFDQTPLNGQNKALLNELDLYSFYPDRKNIFDIIKLICENVLEGFPKKQAEIMGLKHLENGQIIPISFHENREIELAAHKSFLEGLKNGFDEVIIKNNTFYDEGFVKEYLTNLFTYMPLLVGVMSVLHWSRVERNRAEGLKIKTPFEGEMQKIEDIFKNIYQGKFINPNDRQLRIKLDDNKKRQ